MNNTIIDEKLQQYTLKTIEDEENALKEILQEIALFALSTTDFFTQAAFQGGTSLRILYQLPRFSEDLDFLLKAPNKNFNWEKYTKKIMDAFKLYGIEPEIKDRSKSTSNVQKLFLKDNSIGKIINLNFQHHSQRKLLIKLEIDTNPPLGSQTELKFLDFPTDFSINTQDLPSNFAGKCHALLCRQYLKGRDWYDFAWYVSKNSTINFKFLENAMRQNGPRENTADKIDKEWLTQKLNDKITSINWKLAKQEVEKFIDDAQLDTLNLWSKEFFLSKLEKLSSYL